MYSGTGSERIDKERKSAKSHKEEEVVENHYRQHPVHRRSSINSCNTEESSEVSNIFIFIIIKMPVNF